MGWMEEYVYENSTICDESLSSENFLHFSLIPAVFIVGVLSFLQRRTKKHVIDQRFPFLQGRFGMVIPMDAMGFSNRLSYGFAFGAISYSVLELFYEKHIPRFFPNWAKAIAYLIGAFEVGLAHFPFFACLSTPYKATGAMMGICYSIFWITIVGLDWFTCLYVGKWGNFIKPVYEWPRILSLIFLLGRFFSLLVKAVHKQCKSEQEDCEELMHTHQIEHVRRLLRKTAVYRQKTLSLQYVELILIEILVFGTLCQCKATNVFFRSNPLNWFQRCVYQWDPHFKFPNRLIGTAIISLLTLYTVVTIDFGVISALFKLLYGDNLAEIPQLWDVIWKCYNVTLVSASLNMVAYICHILVCYRKQIKRLWKGHKDFLPKKLQNPISAVSVASIAKYSGWQIAFTLWGYLIIRIVQFGIVFVIAYAIIIPIIDGKGWELFKTVGNLLVTVGLLLVLFKLQVFLVQCFFLQDKMSPTDDQKPLALNNRNAFNCFNYFFFFYNVVLGITSCFLRIMISLMLGTWLVSRIDRTIMQKGYERLDRGYCTWIGMIFADHHHNNPVMVCFCQLLLSHIQGIQHDSSYSILNNTPCDSAQSRVKKRWRLFYTLLKNPHLIPLRKQHLQANVPLKLSSSPQADIVVRAWLMRSEAATEMVSDKC